jgi:hypothetical protein
MRKIAQHPAFGKNMLYSSCTPMQRAMAKEQIIINRPQWAPRKVTTLDPLSHQGFSGEAIQVLSEKGAVI